MVKKKSVITLIGVRQAREGFAFIHQGPSPECEGCQNYQVCIENLDAGRVYKIVGLRDRILPCKLHEIGARVVEVIESDILTVLPSIAAIEGAVITYQKQECSIQECQFYERCVSRGLVNGDRCSILEVGEKVECSRGLPLVRVVLRRLSAS